METEPLNVEYACGHVRQEALWKDEAKRKAQLARLEVLPCRDCLAAGWRPEAGKQDARKKQ